MNAKPTKTEGTRSDLARLDAMRDEDIVYDEDTGLPLTAADLDKAQGKGFIASSDDEFRRKMSDHI